MQSMKVILCFQRRICDEQLQDVYNMAFSLQSQDYSYPLGAQVSRRLYCPEENDILKRLQRSTCIKFVQFPQTFQVSSC